MEPNHIKFCTKFYSACAVDSHRYNAGRSIKREQ